MGGWETFLRENSWLGFLGYVLVKEVWPFFRDKIWPQRVAAAEAAAKEAAATAAAERDRLKALEERGIQAEERQAKAMESIGISNQQIALAASASNERISQLITMLTEHDRFTREFFLALNSNKAIARPARKKK